MLFDRVYRLLIGKKGQSSGIEITELRISFNIEKTSDKNPNSNKMQIWNLKKSTRQELEKPDTRCVLYAGYKEESGPILIFSGGIAYAWTKFDGPDVVTEFELGDGLQEIRDTTISVGYGKNVKSKQVFNDVAKKMQIPLTMSSDIPDRSWNNGLSYYGSARTLLDKTTKASDTEWSIQNGNLQIIEKGMVTTRPSIEISSSSGMIGFPESEREAESQTGGGGKKAAKKDSKQPKKYWYGWKVKTLLMPMIGPGDRVLLKSKSVEGVFRVEELTHSGDSWEGDWQTELKLVDPAKPLKKGDKTGGKSNRGAEDDDIDPEELQ